MTHLKLTVFAVIILLTIQNISAQQEQSLNFMTNTWQAHLTNPALLPSKKIAIALPSVYFNINSPDLVLKDVIVTENGRNKLYIDKLYAPERAEVTHLNANVQVQTLGISFPVSKKLSLSIYQATSASPSVSFKRDLVQLFYKGNADYLGKTVSFGSSVNGDIHSEIGIGATYSLPMFTLGGRVKLLSGIAGVFTNSDKLDISFNQTDYSLQFATDFDVRAFSASRLKNISTVQNAFGQGLFSKNNGVSFDLGGSAKLGKMQINASIIDIGGNINWKDEGIAYSSKGNYSYTGRDEKSIQQFFHVDSITSNSFTDTLKKVVGYVETSGTTYTQKLPMKIYLSGSYELNEKVSFGALFYNESGGNVSAKTGFAVDATMKVLDIANVLKVKAGLTYGLRNGKFNNLGAHITLNAAKCVQVFAVTDNILTAFTPYSATSANGRVGMGLIF